MLNLMYHHIEHCGVDELHEGYQELGKIALFFPSYYVGIICQNNDLFDTNKLIFCSVINGPKLFHAECKN